MKTIILGLILMLFTFSTLPVQAAPSDNGVKLEIIKAEAFNFVNVLEVSFEAPQVIFNNYSVYNPIVLQNYNIEKAASYLNVLNFKKEMKSRRLTNKNNANLTMLDLNYNKHIDPGNLLF